MTTNRQWYSGPGLKIYQEGYDARVASAKSSPSGIYRLGSFGWRAHRDGWFDAHKELSK